MSQAKKKDFDFSKLAASYDDGTAGKASQRFYNLLLREVELKPGAKVLDVGCGTGAFLRRLASKLDLECYGTDLEENMLTEAKKKCPQMSFTLASCDNLPFDSQTFDSVVNCMAFHHFKNRDGFAKEAARIIKPGGTLYIADPRFPLIIRKIVNGFFRIIRIEAAFFNSREIVSHFEKHGFVGIGTAVHGYAQVVKLQKISAD